MILSIPARSGHRVILPRSRSKSPSVPGRKPTKRTESGHASPAAWTRRDATHSSVPLQWRRRTGVNQMDDRSSDLELAEMLWLPTDVGTPAERRHPFKEYTYEELTNAPKKVYLCGDDDSPVLLADALWQTMGLLKSAKTYFCMELGFCIAFGLEFHGLPT